MACKMDILLANGARMPALGFGTWRASDEEVEKALNEALIAGYRHIDTAPVYLNEKMIGKVLKQWLEAGKLTREELFIVTKLPPHGTRACSVEKFLKRSLADLQMEYVDLYLIHVPFTVPEVDGPFLMNEDKEIVLETTTDHIALWKAMEKVREDGLARNIGLSNFNQRQIQRIIDNCQIKPANLQIENHIYLQQPELVKFCKSNGISVTAYSPLGSKGIETLLNREVPNLLENPVVKEIANKLRKSVAQVLLRHLLQRGISTIPKSTNAKRVRENIDLFDFKIEDSDMALLDALDQNIRICDFGFFPGISKHPEFPF
ncbi:aldo-keto reductase family 1 member A1 [Wyeomyia smithii]|uniref:aldo-keto reductase family 1 member A1 n=1 Tax=Wyeomyia smithii TaxID=174621 RepID=UPI0024680A1B|nr:aldo-keto reductase family 1 member A1 [Wyeomyia smithii]XP_055525294.1 aldo-keto reductase family 1 member A1 [Wyeomyia smithii]